VKLTDFGLSKLRASDLERMQTRCGTPAYAAPEIIKGEEYDGSVDIWSLGVILYLLLHCQYPYMGDGIDEIYAKIEAGEPEFPNTTKSPLSLDAKDLILRLLQFHPQNRLSMEQICEHPWMKNFEKSSAATPMDSIRLLDDFKVPLPLPIGNRRLVLPPFPYPGGHKVFHEYISKQFPGDL